MLLRPGAGGKSGMALDSGSIKNPLKSGHR